MAVRVARQYFDTNELNRNIIINDGRYGTHTIGIEYDLIAIEAYQQPCPPVQLAMPEFFPKILDTVIGDGVAVMNDRYYSQGE